MFAVFVILFAANFLAAENFVIPNIVEENSISIQTSTSENIVENALENAMSMGSSMQSTVENVEPNITDIDSPLENIIEEIVEESELDMVDNITEIGSGIENMSENVELLSENIEEALSSPIQNLESPLMAENIISEMGSSLITPTMMGSEIIEEAMSGNIREMESTIPSMSYATGTLSPMQNLPLPNTLSTMEELEIMSDIESMMPHPSSTGPSMMSQIGGNYMLPSMESIPEMENSLQNMPYLSNMRPSSSMTSQIEENYMPLSMESIPGMGNLPPGMSYPSNIRPSYSMTSQTGENYMPPLMESIPGMGNLQPNIPYPSMTGLSSPLTSTMQQLESQISQPSSTMPYPENMSPLMPHPPHMPLSPTSSIQELESELDYTYPRPGPMIPGMGNVPMTSYPPNMGLLSPITSTIKEVESEIEETSIPLMNLINQSPLMPQFSGPVLSLPSLGSTLEELEEVTTSNIPLLGTMSGGSLSPMRPIAPKMPQGMEALIKVPSIGSALAELEQGINSAPLPLMKTMPIIGNSLPMLQKPPTMGGYSTNLLNKENIQPLGELSPSNMGYAPGSGFRLPFMNSLMSPFQTLPLMNRFVSPLMSNLSNMQQPMISGNQQTMPNGGLLSPLRQAMSNFKMIPSLLQQPSISNKLNMGQNSMLSSTGLSELTSLIDQDSMLPSSEKNQLLSQMSNLGPSTLAMMQNMYRMMGNDWQSRLHCKIEKVRQARRELEMAIEAMMSGHAEEVPRHIMAAIAALGNSPITTALQYALNQDMNSLSLITNMSRLILQKIQ